MRTIRHLGLFEGIGGFSIAARMRGWDTVAMVEWNPFCQVVLKHHFPDADIYGDITKVDFRQYEKKVEIITGGFPCQPFSTAGKRGGDGDDRFLWPEMLRAVKEVKPVVVIGENVPGIISIFEQQASASVEVETLQLFDQVDGFGRRKDHIRIHKRIAAGVIDDLKQAGYLFPETEDGTPIIFCIPACGVEAPHERQRIFFVAYRADAGVEGLRHEWEDKANELIIATDTSCGERQERSHFNGERENEAQGGAGDRRKREGSEIAVEKGFKPGSESGRELEGGLEGLRSNESAADPSFIGQQQSGPTRSGRAGSSDSGGDVNESAPDTDSNGLEGSRSSDKHRQSRSPEGDASERLSAHERSIRFQGFPTQSPVCGGDDGLPRELDGITFSKWREESIKAYGNAVVPQLAFELYELVEPLILAALKSRS